MAILVIGGVGYIRSHTCVELLTVGYDVVVADNLYSPSGKALERIEKIIGGRVKLCETDFLDQPALKEMFNKEKINSVIHFADLKTTGESVREPLEYYHNNITGALILRGEMRSHEAKNIIFSSSATAYGDLAEIPITESCLKGEITNSYGRTKGMLEQVPTDLHTADPERNVVLLRYFNPISAHENELIGKDPKGTPNNLVPYTVQVVAGRLDHLSVFGDDYDTPDGTGVRDYIHVVDLARSHVRVVQKLQDKKGISIYSLGTGVGYSVLDVFHAYGKARGRTLKCEIQPHREGDVATCYSDSAKAKRELSWVAEKGIEEMCADSRKWQSMNPNGYRDQG